MAAQAPGFVGFLNPITRRLLKVGPLLGPNALLTIRGRNSGLPRTTPVFIVELQGRRWVVGTFGETNWVRNLRSAAEATITVGNRRYEVKAREMGVAERTAFFRDTVGPYVRSVRVLPLLLSVLGAREVLEDPAAAAEKRPVFELSEIAA